METSERILAGAAQQVEDFGPRRFTIDDLARRLGNSRVTIYRYFPKRDRLVEAVLLRETHRFLRAIDAAVAPYDTLERKLIEGGAALAMAEQRVVLRTMARHLDLEETSAKPERPKHRNVTIIPAHGGRVLARGYA